MITDFDSLKLTIVSFMGRSDLTTEIETFIQMAESSLNNRETFRVREMSKTEASVVANSSLPLPADYLAMRILKNAGGNALTLVSPQIMSQEVLRAAVGCPAIYSELAGNLEIHPVTVNVNMELTYYQKIPPLNDVTPTNWLLTKSPDIYLYGSLLASTGFVKNDERIDIWKTLYEEAINLMTTADKADRWEELTRVDSARPLLTNCTTTP